MNRIWLSGWQCSQAVFQPLWHALGSENETVLCYENTTLTRQQWLQQQVELIPPETTLIGWSLGGMLSYELAAMTSNVCRVFVLNANTQFSGGPGLETTIAENFRQRYAKNPEVTRKRFSALVDSENPELIQTMLFPGDHLSTLNWLYESRISELALMVPTKVMLSNQDRLVPAESAALSWQSCSAEVACVEGEHSLPLMQPELVAQWIRQHG
jgi:pimeloyl-ACP methyl ester carboxylesterase